jgi:hypothetical protein
VLLMIVVACAGPRPAPRSAPPATGDPTARRLDALDTYAERACACRDRACAEALDDEIAAELPKTPTPMLFEDAAASARADVAMQRSIRCLWQQRVVAFGFEVVAREITEGARDKACGCGAARCGRVVSAAELRRANHLSVVPQHEAVGAELRRSATEVRACGKTPTGASP